MIKKYGIFTIFFLCILDGKKNLLYNSIEECCGGSTGNEKYVGFEEV